MGFRVIFLLAALITAGPAAADSDFAKGMLDAHNRERASVSVPPLIWSDTLAGEAQAWADHLAQLGHAVHSKPAERNHEGESLWQGTANAYAPDQIVAGWIAEKTNFVYGTFPAVTKSGDAQQVVGHYTQVIWRNTKQVGCAKVNAGAWDIVVCRYSPAGNLVGEKPY